MHLLIKPYQGLISYRLNLLVKLVALCIMLYLPVVSAQQNNATLIDLSTPFDQPIGHNISFLLEKERELSQQQAITLYQTGQFSQGNNAVLSFGIASQPVWLALSINNASQHNLQRHLVLAKSWLDDIQLSIHHRTTGDILKQRQGDRYPFSERTRYERHFAFPLDIPPGISDILLRVETPDPLVVPVYLLTSQQQDARILKQQYSYGLLYGYLLALMLYNFILFIGLRDKIYLLYSLLLVSFSLANFSYTGHGFMLLWPEHPVFQQWAQPLLMLLFASSGLIFAMAFLNIKRFSPRLTHSVHWLIGSVSISFAALIVLNQQGMALVLAFTYVTSYIVLMLAMGIYALHQHQSNARYFLIAVTAGSLGVTITALTTWGFIPFNDWLFRSAEVGMLIEATLLALALSNRIRSVQQRSILVEKLADTDLLTQLNNRRGFFNLSQQVWSNAVRHNRLCSVIIFDLDGFKRLNDNHGHEFGDHVLRTVGRLIQQLIRKGDVAARWGGEEFLLLLPETSLEQAKTLAERLRNGIAVTELEHRQNIIRFTASFGVAEQHANQQNIETLIAQADRALYYSKSMGKNQVTTFQDVAYDTANQVSLPSS